MKCSDKVPFPTKRLALKRAISNYFYYKQAERFNVYECKRCQKWHITQSQGCTLDWWRVHGNAKTREYIERYESRVGNILPLEEQKKLLATKK